jgi:NADPH:quinone reductase-like Zn-dependent oxidoreductase
MLPFEQDIPRSRTMRAIVYTRYGPPDVLQLREIERPEPGEDQVLVKVHAASVNALDYRRTLKPQGNYVCVVGTLPQVFQSILLGPLVSRIGGKKMGFMGIAKTNQKDLALMRELLEVGKVVLVIDRYCPLSEVAEAIRYLAERHAKGKVVIKLGNHSN